MNFTRQTFVSAFVLALLSLGVYLILRAVFEWRSKSGSRSASLATALAGLAAVAAVAISRPLVVFDLMRLRVVQGADGLTTIITVAGSLAVGIGIGDYLFGRLIPGIAGWRGRVSGNRTKTPNSTFETTLILGSGAIISLGAIVALGIVDPTISGELREATGLTVELVAEYELPDEPRDLVLINQSSGYISFANSLSLFEISDTAQEGDLFLEEVVSSPDIKNPRGLAIAEDFLFVAQQGDPQESAPEGMYSTDGAVIRYRVQEDGSLTDRTAIVEQVPIADTFHGINGMAVGLDNKIYLSVGGTRTQFSPEPTNVDWLGTILRFDIDGNGLEVFAQGLRNVYDLEFDEQGRLWGVDNDGPTDRGYRAEEVLQIKEGHHYGYPFEGTFGDHTIRTDRPVWAYTGGDLEGTAGIELTERLGLDPGLLIGARVLSFFRFDEDDEGTFAWGEVDFHPNEIVFSRQGFFTIVEAAEDGLLFVGVNGLSLNSNLYLLRVSS